MFYLQNSELPFNIIMYMKANTLEDYNKWSQDFEKEGYL